MKKPITRREFLGSAARWTATSAVVSSLPWMAGCGNGGTTDMLAPGTITGKQSSGLGRFAFTDVQRRALSAAVARLVPAEAPGDWSAADAGAVEYIEQLLNSFSESGNPKVYAQGPTREHFAEFQPLSRAKTAGWQQEVLRLRELYVQGLNELNRLARGPLSVLPGEFSSLPPPAQDALLTSIDLRGSPFFAALYAHTMEGVYSHPVYGGNRDYIAWDSVCYQGDVHGVRFPSGHDPTADDRPWDKFGGYAPDEMIHPGTCGGGPPLAAARTNSTQLKYALQRNTLRGRKA